MSSKEQTEHHLNLEVFVYVVTQIMKQRPAKVEKVSAISVEKQGIWHKFPTQREDKKNNRSLLIKLEECEESILQVNSI